MKFSAIFFLVLMVFVPTLAHADIFVQLSQNGVRGCGIPTGFPIDCSKDYNDGLFSAISCKVMTTFNKGVVPMYCKIVTSGEYISAIHALMALFVIVWGVTFLIGNVATTTGTAMVNLFKLTFVYFFCVNSDLFFGFLYPTVLGFPAELVGLVLGSAGGGDFFVYVDGHFTKVFSQLVKSTSPDGSTTEEFDFSLFLMGIAVGKLVPCGGFITGLFFMVISGWLMAYINIMVRYLISIMALIFLLMLTPIFLPAKLFKALEFMTDEWIKMIVSFSIQVVVVVMFLIMIEPFFIDFIELIKLGVKKTVGGNGIVLERGYIPGLSGQGNGVEAVFQKSGVTEQNANAYVDKLKVGDIIVDGQPLNRADFVPWFMFTLLQAFLVIYLTYQFMKSVPRFAGLIAGNPKFVAIMQAPSDGGFGSPQKGTPVGGLEQGMDGILKGFGKVFQPDNPPPPPPAPKVDKVNTESKNAAENEAGRRVDSGTEGN